MAASIGPTEPDLVARAQLGDQGAFAALVDARLQPTFRTVLALIGNEADARDVTQAIFVQAWNNLPALRDSEKFGAWFGRIVVNAARSSMRGRRRRMVREITVGALPDEGGSLTSGHAATEDRVVSLDRLGRAFDRIEPTEREVLWLHHYEDLSLADIAQRLEVPASTVKSRLFTARRALERALEAEDR